MNQKLDLKVYTIIICAASFVSSLLACNVTNRFGEDCVYNCHCKLNTLCTENGGCPEGCQEGWFGPECQYSRGYGGI
uniref:EGF-like domain-containing protein n=1 Tax=Biomphalaria glabrata TaxID=6526 RepID=A0A2C9LWB4_BIOGL